MHRKEYMAPFISDEESTERHQKYYGQFVDDHVLLLLKRNITSSRIVNSTDPHFNDIPLKQWDALVPLLPRFVCDKLKEQGDYLTLATGICILKQAARQIKESHQLNGV